MRAIIPTSLVCLGASVRMHDAFDWPVLHYFIHLLWCCVTGTLKPPKPGDKSSTFADSIRAFRAAYVSCCLRSPWEVCEATPDFCLAAGTKSIFSEGPQTFCLCDSHSPQGTATCAALKTVLTCGTTQPAQWKDKAIGGYSRRVKARTAAFLAPRNTT